MIDAVDTSDNTYRITFDRHGIGTHSIPDYEVLVSRLVFAQIVYIIFSSYVSLFEDLRIIL